MAESLASYAFLYVRLAKASFTFLRAALCCSLEMCALEQAMTSSHFLTLTTRVRFRVFRAVSIFRARWTHEGFPRPVPVSLW